MKKYLALSALPLLFACGGGNKTTPLEESLTKANIEMTNEVSEKEVIINSKESALNEFVKSFNEIQNNLNQIKAKEKILSSNKKGVELNKSAKDQIISDIEFIYEQMNKNKEKLISVRKRLKDSNIKIDDLETALANLRVQITNNESEIAELKYHLENLNVDFSNLKINYDNLQETYETAKQVSDQKTATLNTAYYAIGTAKNLKKDGIITEEGGFIGIGKTKELNEKINSANFIKVDITMVTEISLNAAKKVKLLTTHPQDSYKFVKSNYYDKLEILSPEKFWEASKYLVIETEK